MNPATLILALQEKGIDIKPDLITGGGMDKTKSMLNFAFVDLDKRYYRAFCVKWCGDYDSRLAENLLFRISGIAVNENWNYKKYQLIRLCELAVHELARPAGFKEDKDKALFFQVHKSTWSRVWKKRYNEIYNILSSWTDIAWDHVQKKIK